MLNLLGIPSDSSHFNEHIFQTFQPKSVNHQVKWKLTTALAKILSSTSSTICAVSNMASSFGIKWSPSNGIEWRDSLNRCSLNGLQVSSEAIGTNFGNSTSFPECDVVFFLFNLDANAIAMDCLTGRLLCELLSILLDLLGDVASTWNETWNVYNAKSQCFLTGVKP